MPIPKTIKYFSMCQGVRNKRPICIHAWSVEDCLAATHGPRHTHCPVPDGELVAALLANDPDLQRLLGGVQTLGSGGRGTAAGLA